MRCPPKQDQPRAHSCLGNHEAKRCPGCFARQAAGPEHALACRDQPDHQQECQPARQPMGVLNQRLDRVGTRHDDPVAQRPVAPSSRVGTGRSDHRILQCGQDVPGHHTPCAGGAARSVLFLPTIYCARRFTWLRALRPGYALLGSRAFANPRAAPRNPPTHRAVPILMSIPAVRPTWPQVEAVRASKIRLQQVTAPSAFWISETSTGRTSTPARTNISSVRGNPAG